MLRKIGLVAVLALLVAALRIEVYLPGGWEGSALDD
jgi:hypothetical protein